VSANGPHRETGSRVSPVLAHLALALALVLPLAPVCPALAGEAEASGSSCCGCCEMPSDCACGGDEGGAPALPATAPAPAPEAPPAAGHDEGTLSGALLPVREESRGYQSIAPPGSSPPLFLSDCSFRC
jgi:hypothetical protein